MTTKDLLQLSKEERQSIVESVLKLRKKILNQDYKPEEPSDIEEILAEAGHKGTAKYTPDAEKPSDSEASIKSWAKSHEEGLKAMAEAAKKVGAAGTVVRRF